MDIKSFLERNSAYTPKAILRRLFMVSLFTIGICVFLLYIVELPPQVNIIGDIAKMIVSFISISEFIVLLDRYLEKREPLSFQNINKRVAMQFGLSWIFTLAVFLILFSSIYDRRLLMEENFVLASSFVTLTMLLLFMSVSFLSLFIRVFQSWFKLNTEVERLKVEKVELKYRALQDQLNPHFFFNNLSALKSLILLKDYGQALRFIQDFSSICRYVLQRSDWKTVSLKEEITFTEQYFELQKIRNEDGITLSVNIPEEFWEKEIPPMAVQMLVENAIKHNIASDDSILRIKIHWDGQYLAVSNNLQKKKTYRSTGKGLDNLGRRFSHLTQEQVLVESTENEFIVRLPLI
ncbi:sensor histidine kinase [Fulvitalea axinellae]